MAYPTTSELANKLTSRKVLFSLLAGLGASSIHLVLMELKHRTGILPEFDPYSDLQRMLSSVASPAIDTSWVWLLTYINGAMLLGFLFGQIFPYLPSKNVFIKGTMFGVFSWLLLGLVFLPLIGSGPFAYALGLGAMPALLMLAMLMVYSIAVSLLYAKLTRTADTA
jgi:hypothetical protein